MTRIKEIKNQYYKKLPLSEIDLLISFVLKKDKVFVLTFPEYIISKSQKNKIESLIKKRLNNIPMAYILGYKEFYGNKFLLNENVLVPRPETELMVDEAIKITMKNKQTKTIVDIGTGSGCIIVSLAKKLGVKNNYIGIDISPKALNIAKKNAKSNKVDKLIIFKKSDLLKNFKNQIIASRKSQIIITANLPYLTPEQIKNSPSIKKEPRLALLAGKDGLKYYRSLFHEIKELKNKKPNLVLTILSEIDPSQKNTFKKLSTEIFGNNFYIEIKKDLKNHSRLAVLQEKRPSIF